MSEQNEQGVFGGVNLENNNVANPFDGNNSYNVNNPYNGINQFNGTNNYNEATGIYNHVGTASFSETDKSISINKKLTLDELNTSLSITLSDDLNTIQMYLTMMGYTCQ